MTDYNEENYPVMQGNPMMPQMMGYSDKADFLDKIKPDLIVTELMHRLMGEEFIQGRWVKNVLMKGQGLSYRGAYEIATIMLSASSQNVSISKIKDKDVRMLTLGTIKAVLSNCCQNWKAYGITNSSQIRMIRQIVQNNSFVTLKQPDEGSIQNVIKGTTHEQRMVNSNEKQGGVIDRIIRSN